MTGDQTRKVRIHYDMMCHPEGCSRSSLYQAAVDIADYADARGCTHVVFSEHHLADYMTCPISFANAVAARTKHVSLTIQCAILANYDIMRLAEETAQLDIVSNGRLELALAWGYDPAERAMYPRNVKAAELMETAIAALRKAWAGETFTYGDRQGKLVQLPVQSKLRLYMGGSSEVTARRAAQLTDGYIPTHNYFADFYKDERQKLGKDIGALHIVPNYGFIHVTKQPEDDWQRIRKYAVHDTQTYWQWMKNVPGLSYSAPPNTVEECKADGRYQILTPAEAVEYLQSQQEVYIKPLLGGLDPTLAWESVKLLFEDVIPALNKKKNLTRETQY